MSERSAEEGNDPGEAAGASALWRRLSDHRVVQWVAAYVGVAYAIQHAVVLTGEAFEWPQLVQRITMLLLILGFPFIVTVAWYHGERASRSVSKAEASIIALLVVIGSLFFYVFVNPASEIAAARAPVAEAGVTAARNAAADPHGAISIAVLPFTNLSGDANQEFFSDGMTEEITAALAKIPDLRVVGRTSAFQFKGQNQDLRAIGQSLSASHLLEGSVRKDGNRLRITAQLVKAEDGVHVWTENYDRELTSIFAIQEDIARAIAAALRMPLNLPQGQQLVSSRTNDLDTYQEYLRVRVLVRARGVGAREDLEALIKRAPNFAPAWALMADGAAALTVALMRQSGPDEEIRKQLQTAFNDSEIAARKAIALDPTLPSGYAELSRSLQRQGKWLEGEEVVRKALMLDPDNPEALSDYGNLLAHTGRIKQALPIRVQLKTLEPFDNLYSIMTTRIMAYMGQSAAALATFESISPDIRLNYNRNVALAEHYAEQGRYSDAVNSLLLTTNPVLRPAIERAAEVLRTAPNKTTAPERLPVLRAELSFIYAHVGALDRVLDEQERAVRVGNLYRLYDVWNPRYASLRNTPRFKKLMEDTNLVVYWRAKGWPDFCHPTAGDDFECS